MALEITYNAYEVLKHGERKRRRELVATQEGWLEITYNAYEVLKPRIL